jgi:glycosyltransferase involved in cell wall biosynthesis
LTAPVVHEHSVADMKARLRILHIVHNLDYGGLERLVGALVRFTDPARFENHILTLRDLGRFAEGLEGHAELHRHPPMHRLSLAWPLQLTRVIRAIAPDVVHTHSGVWYKAALAACRAGVPRLVHTDHGRQYPDPWAARLLDGLAARRTDVVVAVSETLARQLADTVVGDPDRIRVVKNGVDTERFRPMTVNGKMRRELSLPSDAPVIGSIGRLEPIKGYDVMIRAFAMLRDGWSEGPLPALVIVGDGSERARLAALVDDHGLGAAVHLAGWRGDVERCYALFDVFTLSSWSEGTPLGLLEAMSAGVCPVATDVGGTAAVLGDSLRHRLVPPGDPAALARAWRDALQHGDRRVADATATRRRVEQHFGLRAMVEAYERIYRGEPAES